MRTRIVALAMALRAASAEPLADIEMRSEYLGFFRDVILNRLYNPHDASNDGHTWPPGAIAVSMAGQRRLDSFSALLATAIEDGVPGHVIETGVWRGGASFMAAKTMELMGAKAAGRRTYLADSFQGIPDQTTYGRGRFASDSTTPAADSVVIEGAAPSKRMAKKAATTAASSHSQSSWFGRALSIVDPLTNLVRTGAADKNAHLLTILNNNSPERVRADAVRMGLDMRRLTFVVGFFNESIPKLVKEEPDVQFAVVRLDGDTFLSTYEAIELLYPRLSPGGFLIVDDYLDWLTCHKAIDLYRQRHSITEPIIQVPHEQGEEARGVYWRKQPAPGQLLCAAEVPGSLRPRGWLRNRSSVHNIGMMHLCVPPSGSGSSYRPHARHAEAVVAARRSRESEEA